MALRIGEHLYQMYDISRYFDKDKITLAHFVDNTYEQLKYVQCPKFEGYYCVSELKVKKFVTDDTDRMYLYPELNSETNTITMKGGIYEKKNTRETDIDGTLQSPDGWDGLCERTSERKGSVGIVLNTNFKYNKQIGAYVHVSPRNSIIVDECVYDCRHKTIRSPNRDFDSSPHFEKFLDPDVKNTGPYMWGCDKETTPRIMQCTQPVTLTKEDFKAIIDKHKKAQEKLLQEYLNQENLPPKIVDDDNDLPPPYTTKGGKSRHIRKSRRKIIRKSRRSKKNRKTRKNYK